MEAKKRKRLEEAGWCLGSVEDFLGLEATEVELIEIKLALTHKLKELRENQQLTQESLAKKMKSSQSRIAKIEAGDPSVSIDLIIRALFSTGATRQDIAEAIFSSK